MSLSLITRSVLIQLVLFLFVRGCLFFPRFEVANYLYIGTIAEFFSELTIGTLWLIVVQKLFPGQLLVYFGLPIVLVYSLLLMGQKESRSRALITFHSAALVWIFLPVVVLKFGTYSGP